MNEFWIEHGGQIIVGLITATCLGLVGIIRGFFSRIRKMGERIDELDAKLEQNTRSDEDLKKYVNLLIEEKIKK